MKKGDYVRTLDGVKRIKSYEYREEYENGHVIHLEGENCGWLCTDEEVKEMKPTANLLDLLEPGDLILVDIAPDDCGGIPVYRILETQEDLNKRKKAIRKKENILRGIITKEQLSKALCEVKDEID